MAGNSASLIYRENEREKAAENILSRQCIEGISAFLEKRPPKWST